MPQSLWGQNSPAPNAQGGNDPIEHWRMDFTVSSAIEIDRISWWKIANAQPPRSIALWNATAGTLIQRKSALATTGSGWIHELFDPTTLSPGTTYALTLASRPATFWAYSSQISLIVPDAPFSFVSANGNVFKSFDETTLPTALYGGGNMRIGVSVGDLEGEPPPPDPPPDPPDEPTPYPNPPLSGDLAYWLHNETLNPNSAPKMTLDAILNGDYGLAAARAERMALAAVVGTVSSSGSGTVMGRLAAASTALGAIAALLEVVKNTTDLIKGWQDTQGDLSAKLDTLAGDFSSNIGRDQIAIPGSGWVMRMQTAGIGPGTWDEPADRYVFTITNPEVLEPGRIINGLPYHTHRGWWSPLNIDLVGNYNTMVANKHEWYEVGQRLPGAIWWVDTHIEWTLEAYDYSPGA